MQLRSVQFFVLCLQILLINDEFIISVAKRGGVGRSGGRAGGYGRPGTNTGARISQPVNRPSNTGVGYKKPGGSWAKPALAGAAGAVIGAAVAHQLTSSYYKSRYDGRDYYYGDRYYRPSYGYSTKCAYPLPEGNRTSYVDGYQVKELVFECDGRTEYCCEMQCCPRARRPNNAYTSTRMSWWSILLLFLGIIAVASCCIFAFMKYRRSHQASFTATPGEASVPLQAQNGAYPYGGKAYAPQPTPYYPNAPTYPAGGWQGQPTAYPQAGPPPYGFNVQPAYPHQY